MQIFQFKNLFTRKSRRKQVLVTGLAIAALVVLVTLAAVNANATPISPAEVRLAGWVDELKADKLTAARQDAQRNLELAGESAVPRLLTALRSDSQAQRRNAADILGYIASPLATDALLNTLRNDPVPAVRRNAAWALGEIKSSHAINDLLQSSIADRSQSVRGAAADSLARIRTNLALASGVNEQLVGAFAVSPSQNEQVYVAAKRDLLASNDGGRTWTTLSDVLPSQVSALAVHPHNPQELLAGVDAMGIFYSRNGGETWHPVNAGIQWTPGARQAVSAIAIDPVNPQVIYISYGVWLGTGTVDFHPIGLVASYDGGANWQGLTAGSRSEAIAKLAFREGQLYGLAGDRVLTLVTPRIGSE